MAEEKGYGSGKPLSAAQSRGRRRVAKGQLSKSKKGNAALKKVAAENPVTGFIGGGILPAKLLKAASSLLPQSVRVAGAASRVVKGATSRLSAAEAKISAGKAMQEAASATRVLAGSVPRPGRAVRLGLDFANPSGNKPNQSYSYVIKDMTKKVNPEAPVSGAQMFEAARSMNRTGANTAYNAAKAARRSQKVIDAGKAGAAAEIKRRLAAFQRANRNR